MPGIAGVVPRPTLYAARIDPRPIPAASWSADRCRAAVVKALARGVEAK